jgi:hypothetical protein
MGVVFTSQQITTAVLSGETAIFTDAEYDYRYYRMLVLGAYNDNTYVTLNGVPNCKFGGTGFVDAPIYSVTVDSGPGVLLFGMKHAKTVF